ncbi:MAG: acyltransferase family protein [Candidatus Schekmanbacteria bacterium]|nr:acyltransferase family protein [Candidatus Schekmanbacteria bacterium]
MTASTGDATAWERPTPELLEQVLKLLRPWEILTNPLFFGMDALPTARPLLFVGNHTVMGMLDIPLMIAELYRRQGIFLRSLGDHAHFRIPVWGELLTKLGAIDGTRENCARLMAAKETILVFPGGGREVAKRKGEKYRLIWKDRTGFARMAIQHGCAIVPFAAVGAEESVDIVLDAGEIFASPAGMVLQKLGIRPDIVIPFVRGIGPTPLPRPVRLYFKFCEAIDVSPWAGRHEDEAARFELRDVVKGAVEQAIEELREYRRGDPEKHLFARVLAELRRLAEERSAAAPDAPSPDAP